MQPSQTRQRGGAAESCAGEGIRSPIDVFEQEEQELVFIMLFCSGQPPINGKLTSPGCVIDKVGKERNEPS